jgi:hypothetical protein
MIRGMTWRFLEVSAAKISLKAYRIALLILNDL